MIHDFMSRSMVPLALRLAGQACYTPASLQPVSLKGRHAHGVWGCSRD